MEKYQIFVSFFVTSGQGSHLSEVQPLNMPSHVRSESQQTLCEVGRSRIVKMGNSRKHTTFCVVAGTKPTDITHGHFIFIVK